MWRELLNPTYNNSYYMSARSEGIPLYNHQFVTQQIQMEFDSK